MRRRTGFINDESVCDLKGRRLRRQPGDIRHRRAWDALIARPHNLRRDIVAVGNGPGVVHVGHRERPVVANVGPRPGDDELEKIFRRGFLMELDRRLVVRRAVVPGRYRGRQHRRIAVCLVHRDLGDARGRRVVGADFAGAGVARGCGRELVLIPGVDAIRAGCSLVALRALLGRDILDDDGGVDFGRRRDRRRFAERRRRAIAGRDVQSRIVLQDEVERSACDLELAEQSADAT